jgi:hypothetical protein
MKECEISQFFKKSSKIPSVFEKWTSQTLTIIGAPKF